METALILFRDFADSGSVINIREFWLIMKNVCSDIRDNVMHEISVMQVICYVLDVIAGVFGVLNNDDSMFVLPKMSLKAC